MTDAAAQPAPPEPGRPTAVFDPLGPLPTGTTLLEASAGTGKTHTIAALATRYVAESGIPLDRMLLVTFGRSATRELRERVRGGLIVARDALADRALDCGPNPLVAHLRAAESGLAEVYLQRLSTAVANFDAATITTTHGFAQQSLTTLGLLGDTDVDQTFIEDLSELAGQVVDDLYLRRFSGGDSPPSLTHEEARQIGVRAVTDPFARLAEAPDDPPVAAMRTRLAGAVRAETARRLRVARLVTYDDLIGRLAAALADPQTGGTAAHRLRSRYSVVLVDEFQDTDPKQWQILHDTFHGHRTLILIGDPKQAIYAFRGADVFSYLAAGGLAQTHATLGTNHRSDAQVVHAIADLMGGMHLGDPRIAVGPVAASPRRRVSRISGSDGVGLRLRVLSQDGKAAPTAPGLRLAVAADVAADIARMLHRTTLTVADAGQAPVERQLQPGDIAVLVGRNNDALLVRDQLARAGIPGVVNGTTSVFATPAATAWLELLTGLADPRPAAVRACALTDFLGYSATDLGTRGDTVAEEVAHSLRQWAVILSASSVAAMQAQIEAERGLATRVLSRPAGERELTDLRHIGALLHAQWRTTRTGAAGLAAWLGERIRAAGQETRESGTELTQRLESDAQAVQILTIHRSKGLEFPIAYVPFAWDRYVRDEPPPIVACHDRSGHRLLDVRGRCPNQAANATAGASEDAGESLRLLYVALTRAASQVVVHWAPSRRTAPASPLHRILAARRAGTLDPAASYSAATSAATAVSSQHIAVEKVGPGEVPAVPPFFAAGKGELSAARMDRELDTHWRRTSFTGLTSAAGHASPESAPARLRTDEPDADEPAGSTSEPTEDGRAAADPDSPEQARAEQLSAEPADTTHAGIVAGSDLPFAGLPRGADFGTLVHDVLETLPTGIPDLQASLLTNCTSALAATPIAGASPQKLATALGAAIATPLGPLLGGRSLADIPVSDRLSEMQFELPLGEGGSPATLAAIAKLLGEHLRPDDPLRGYADALPQLPGAALALRGYLSGAIDAVLRVPAVPGAGGPTNRFVVVDYKTNWLRLPGTAPGELQLRAYHPDALPAAMIASNYPLQALLYSVALHRYLRWRLPGYEPAENLAGVAYLYLRGMVGVCTEDGRPYGVFAWQPPASLIVALSELLDGTPSAPSGAEAGPRTGRAPQRRAGASRSAGPAGQEGGSHG